MTHSIPIWGGVECTISRVGHRFISQCEKSGHDRRLQDLKLFRDLGIECVRYPFLWEKIAKSNGEMDWSWADERAAELRRLNLKPIAGLLHHGSGPAFTNLLDPRFPYLFANYARMLAQRFPWIEDYTPINEPLTTARFCGLYGHWYPHLKSDETFITALLLQIKASILAMRAIREVNPKARWIQTEDIGRIQGTDVLHEQVQFENDRRWLSYDLLCGKISDAHPLYSYLREHSQHHQDLDWCLENAMAPTVLGLNHYHLSNRFLDHRLELYPASSHGGNGRIRYADVGTIETKAASYIAPEELFSEVWQRYQLPMAVTEVHMRGFREDQAAWLQEIRQSALNLRSQGADIRAVTAWSLLGSFDWDSLCTQEKGFYESGIFDLRAVRPRPTLLGQMINSWNRGQDFQHPILSREVWWKKTSSHPDPWAAVPAPPILITGGRGTLGQAFVRICQQRNISYRALGRGDMDIASLADVEKVIRELKPWAVINTAGFVRVDEAETQWAKCFRENVRGPQNLAEVCADEGIPLLHFSSDLVFDGLHRQPYTESHRVAPLNIYGKSKAESERRVLDIHPDSLIIRASSFFGPWDRSNFIFQTVENLRQGRICEAASDVVISPTYIPDLVHFSLELLMDRETGILHLTNEGHLSWAEFAEMAAKMAHQHQGPMRGSVQPKSLHEMNFRAARPAFSALASERIQKVMPGFEDALSRYFHETERR